MKLSEAKIAHTFDDVLLVPSYSTIRSRKDPDTTTNIGSISLKIPIISAPMNTVTEWQMMSSMHQLGGTSVLHRYISQEDQLQQCVKALKEGARNFFVAIGATGDFLERAYRLHDTLGISSFCVDVANGHSETCIRAVEKLSGRGFNIMAGNVCTYEAAYHLASFGAASIRVGIGPGSACTTRLVTGFGMPQLSAIEDCMRVKESFSNVSIVADGGIRTSGDIVKALAIGADATIIGGLLAGTDESPGDTQRDTETGQLYKYYHGMASEEGRKEWFEGENASYVPEGASFKVFHKGSALKIIEQLVGGVKVGMSYAGANNLKELRENAEWVRVTDNGRREGNPNRKMFSR